MPFLIGLLVVALLIFALVHYWYITLIIIVIVVAAIVLPKIIRRIRAKRYFASEVFQARKRQIGAIAEEHNDIVGYVSDIAKSGTYQLGSSRTGSQAHLATFENTSTHKYKRDRHVAIYAAANVHNCSLQVVRNAKADPLKYVMKYFEIKPSESSLTNAQNLGESIARLESAVKNLERREKALIATFSPPRFVVKHFRKEFLSQAGIDLSPVAVPYPEYVFEYVSAGGNSSQKTSLKFESPTIDALIETLSSKVRMAKTAAGQRALMTARLREAIKTRDGFACRYCEASVTNEPNLLLEVDHIVPLSRGGLSVVENLQTLCWRCNRTKSNKLVTS